jgi:hypothetical protein
MAVIQVKYDQNGKAERAWEVMGDGQLRQFYPHDDIHALLENMKAAVAEFSELNTKRINAIREENIKKYLSGKFPILNPNELDEIARELLVLAGIEGYRKADK